MNDASYDIENELTGLDEHERDETFECGELAAMRREALREHEMELDAEMEAGREEFEARQADPFTAVCLYDFDPGCQDSGDDLPF